MTHSSIPSCIRQALLAPDAEDRLFALIKKLKSEGFSQFRIYEIFEAELIEIKPDPDETSYNTLADVMDRLVGWCNPSQRIFEDLLSEADITKNKNYSFKPK